MIGKKEQTGGRPSDKNFREFALAVSKLEAIEFMGLVKILGVGLFDKNENEEEEPKLKPRDFEQVYSEILDKYICLGRKDRREVMKVVKLTNLGRIEENLDD